MAVVSLWKLVLLLIASFLSVIDTESDGVTLGSCATLTFSSTRLPVMIFCRSL